MTNFRLFQTKKGLQTRYEQFLLFPQCFQNVCFPGVSKGVVVWGWVNCYWTYGRLSDRIMSLEKGQNAGKGENVCCKNLIISFFHPFM